MGLVQTTVIHKVNKWKKKMLVSGLNKSSHLSKVKQIWQGSIFNFKALNYWSSQVEEDSVVIKTMFCKHPKLCSLGVCNCSPFPLAIMFIFIIITVFIPHSSHAWGGTSLLLAMSQYNYKAGKFCIPNQISNLFGI